MSQKDQGNKQSKKGMARGHGKSPTEAVGKAEWGDSKHERNTVGSTPGAGGIKFPLHDHPDKSDLHSPEK